MNRLPALLSAVAFAVSCASPGGASDAGDTSDSGTGPDAGEAGPDAGGPDAGGPHGLALILNGGAQKPFGEAAAGITVGDPDELYLEAWSGGFTGCPEQASPTPDRTLVVSGVILDGRTSQDEGVSATLFDYEGDILASEPFARASAVRVTALDDHLCAPGTDCDDTDDVTLTLEAEFVFGTLSGRVRAPHCRSFDE